MKNLNTLRRLLFTSILIISSQQVVFAEPIKFSGTKEHQEAVVTINIVEYANLNFTGLKPESTYSAWFINKTPKMAMSGAGEAPYSFITDKNGNAKYSIDSENKELNKWELLKIVLHKDGNPQNMKSWNMLPAFEISTNDIK